MGAMVSTGVSFDGLKRWDGRLFSVALFGSLAARHMQPLTGIHVCVLEIILA